MSPSKRRPQGQVAVSVEPHEAKDGREHKDGSILKQGARTGSRLRRLSDPGNGRGGGGGNGGPGGGPTKGAAGQACGTDSLPAGVGDSASESDESEYLSDDSA